MPTVVYVQPDGSVQSIEADSGATVMETAVDNAVEGIVAECGGACSCATCHVYVADEWLDRTGNASEMEEDMLDFAFDVRDNSRLSCQIKIVDELDGLIVSIPEKQF